MKTSRALLGFAALSLAGVGVHQATVPSAAAGRADAGIGAVRAWTERYHAEAAAIADGFVPTDTCVPGMGYHYVNYSRFDGRIEPSRPEVLIYVDGPDGGRQLVAAEWVVVDRDQDLATTDDRPQVFGHDFDGPMEGHEAGMPRHYDLHAWAWLDNPDGAFTAVNPTVTCPSGGQH